jgi:hypothetical protein
MEGINFLTHGRQLASFQRIGYVGFRRTKEKIEVD